MYMVIVGICFQSICSLISLFIRDNHEILAIILVGPAGWILGIISLLCPIYKKLKLVYIRLNYNQYKLYAGNLLINRYYIHKDISNKFKLDISIKANNDLWKLQFEKPANSIKSFPPRDSIIGKYSFNRNIYEREVLKEFVKKGKVFR